MSRVVNSIRLKDACISMEDNIFKFVSKDTRFNLLENGSFNYVSNTKVVKNFEFTIPPGTGICEIFRIGFITKCNIFIKIECMIKSDLCNKYTSDFHDIIFNEELKNDYTKFNNKYIDFSIQNNDIVYIVNSEPVEQKGFVKIELIGFPEDLRNIII